MVSVALYSFFDSNSFFMSVSRWHFILKSIFRGKLIFPRSAKDLSGGYRQIHFWADCQILLFFHQYLDRLCHCLAGSISSPRSIIYSSAYRCFIKIYWLLAVEHCFFLSFWGNLLVDAQHRMRVLIDFIGWECRYELFVVTVPSYAYFFYKMPKKIVHSYQVSIYDASFIAAFFNFHWETKVVLFESLAVPCPCRKCGLFFPLCLCC